MSQVGPPVTPSWSECYHLLCPGFHLSSPPTLPLTASQESDGEGPQTSHSKSGLESTLLSSLTGVECGGPRTFHVPSQGPDPLNCPPDGLSTPTSYSNQSIPVTKTLWNVSPA